MSTGPVNDSSSVLSRSSAMPQRGFGEEVGRGRRHAQQLGLCGRARCAAPADGRRPRTTRVATGRPVSARNVAGADELRAAERVITTVTPTPDWTSSLTSAAVLYAAMPPVTPMRISRDMEKLSAVSFQRSARRTFWVKPIWLMADR